MRHRQVAGAGEQRRYTIRVLCCPHIYRTTDLLLWVKDMHDFKEMVAGTPLGWLGLLKPKMWSVC